MSEAKRNPTGVITDDGRLDVKLPFNTPLSATVLDEAVDDLDDLYRTTGRKEANDLAEICRMARLLLEPGVSVAITYPGLEIEADYSGIRKGDQ